MERASTMIIPRADVTDGIKLLACGLIVTVSLGLSPARAAGAPNTEAPNVAASEVPKAETAKPSVATVPPVPPAKAEAPNTEAATDPQPETEAQAGVRKYCVNIAAAATDARFAWQSKKLQELETRIKGRIAELDAKQAELTAWLDKRDKVAKEARENLVGIYAKMKPETAASQIGALDDEMAVAVLAALTPRQAGAIFNELSPPDRAAKLAGMLANPNPSANDKKL